MSDPSEREGRAGEGRAEDVAAADSSAEDQDRARAHREDQTTVSEPGGFANDPDDPTNPNEAIERHRRTVRPGPSG